MAFKRNRRRNILLAVLLAGMANVPFVYAQSAAEYPTRPVTLVVPYPPGGVADMFARSMADELGKRLNQAVVVSNRAGANGNIGSAFAAKQPADGYTLLLGSISTLAVNPHMYSDMGYDPIKDLQPITLTHQMPNVLIVGSKTPYKTVADVIQAAKEKPGEIPFGSAGNGNSMHLAGEIFQKQSDIKLMHVPYKGAAPALTDVVGGTLPMMFINVPSVVSYVDSDRIRVLAVTDKKRAPMLPNVPTFAEAGVSDVTFTVWNGILARSGTPSEIVKKLNKEMTAILNEPGFRSSLEKQGYEVLSSTPEEFETLLKNDTARMGTVTQEAGIKMN